MARKPRVSKAVVNLCKKSHIYEHKIVKLVPIIAELHKSSNYLEISFQVQIYYDVTANRASKQKSE